MTASVVTDKDEDSTDSFRWDDDENGVTFDECEHIPTWISLSGDLAFSHQDGIYGFKFPKRFSELSQAKTSLYSLYLNY